MRTFHKTEDTGDFITAPEGTTAGTLIALAFLGNHESVWNGETRTRELVGLAWELAEPGPDGRSLSVTETLTASMHEKAKFYARIMALTGGREPPPGFALSGLLGRGAIITVTHSTKGERTYANVSAVGPLPRGMNAAHPSVAPVFFDIETPDPAAYAALPTRFKKLADTAMGATQAAAPNPAGPWAGQPAHPPAAAPASVAGWGNPPPPPPADYDDVPF